MTGGETRAMFNRLLRTRRLLVVAGVVALAAGAFLIGFLSSSPTGNPDPLAANLPPTPDIPPPQITPHPSTPGPVEKGIVAAREAQREREARAAREARANETPTPYPRTHVIFNSGPETAGLTIGLSGGVLVQLPLDVWVEELIRHITCHPDYQCPETPIHVLARGDDRLWIDWHGVPIEGADEVVDLSRFDFLPSIEGGQ